MHNVLCRCNRTAVLHTGNTLCNPISDRAQNISVSPRSPTTLSRVPLAPFPSPVPPSCLFLFFCSFSVSFDNDNNDGDDDDINNDDDDDVDNNNNSEVSERPFSNEP